jgi:NAD(P)-dependent dehydrogenase (short-subunit alcohol dehydrogenase family)
MLGYEGKNVLVVGGATGMGAAAAQEVAKLGAKVTVLDVAEVSFPVDRFIKIDLRDKASVEKVVGELDGPFHAVFSCAGVADGTRGIGLINFVSQRQLLQGLLAKGALPRGSAVAVISSTAGNGWEQALPDLKEFLAISDWDGEAAWIDAHKSDNMMTNADGYMFTKRAMCAWVATAAFEFNKKGVRLNAILPGPTDTPLARANADIWLAYGTDYRAEIGTKHLQPSEMAQPMIFLCSPLASGISGENLVVDQGQTSSVMTGAFTPGPR